MNRNFISDQELTDRLYFSDTEAFNELYHRYWYNLYIYSLKKLQSSEDAKKVVRDVFVDLWAKRQTWPLDFSVAQFFYTEVRKAVVKEIGQKLATGNLAAELLLDFSNQVQRTKIPAAKKYSNISFKLKSQSIQHKEYRPVMLFNNVKSLFQTLTAKLN